MNKQHSTAINNAINKMQNEYNSKFGNHITISVCSEEGLLDVSTFNCVFPDDNGYIFDYYVRFFDMIKKETYIKESNISLSVEYGTGYIN